jgi:hypothetical protein
VQQTKKAAQKKKEVVQSVTPTVNVTPPTLTDPPASKVQKDGYSVLAPNNPLNPAPNMQRPNHTVVAAAMNIGNDVTHVPEKDRR